MNGRRSSLFQVPTTEKPRPDQRQTSWAKECKKSTPPPDALKNHERCCRVGTARSSTKGWNRRLILPAHCRLPIAGTDFRVQSYSRTQSTYNQTLLSPLSSQPLSPLSSQPLSLVVRALAVALQLQLYALAGSSMLADAIFISFFARNSR